MTTGLHVLTGSGRLRPHVARIEAVARAALANIGNHLPLAGVDVVFQDFPAAAIPALGLGGYAPTGHLVHVSLDPAAEDFVEKLERHLPRTLAHEWHHCARWRGPGYGTTLGEALVSEGLADHFDLEVFGGEPYEWSRALGASQARDLWTRAASELWRPGYDHARWFFNRSEEGPPFHAGYALGFRVVTDFLERLPGAQPSRLWDSGAREIVRGSGRETA